MLEQASRSHSAQKCALGWARQVTAHTSASPLPPFHTTRSNHLQRVFGHVSVIPPFKPKSCRIFEHRNVMAEAFSTHRWHQARKQCCQAGMDGIPRYFHLFIFFSRSNRHNFAGIWRPLLGVLQSHPGERLWEVMARMAVSKQNKMSLGCELVMLPPNAAADLHWPHPAVVRGLPCLAACERLGRRAVVHVTRSRAAGKWTDI